MKTLLLMGWLFFGINTCLYANDDKTTEVRVTVTNLRSEEGQVILSLFDNAEDFPSQKKAIKTFKADIRDGKANFQFHLPAGTYAFAFTHDENNNGKRDTNFIGMPKEGVGASNNAKGSFGPPKFEDAKFTIADQPIQSTVETNYL
ncbi:DUF2141 domain-containing protein [Persicobacter diffluens]